MNWTNERIDLLKKLWTEGVSASLIANQIGGVSRNSVIGKAHRLALPSRGRGTSYYQQERATRSKRKTSDKAKSSKVTAANTNKRPEVGVAMVVNESDRTISVPAEPKDPKDHKQLLSDVVVPISRKLQLVQLNESTCKWPKGNPWDEDFSFCGNDVDKKGPYCLYHSRIAFQPVEQRRRKR